MSTGTPKTAATETLVRVPLLDIPLGNEPLMDQIFDELRAACDKGQFVGGKPCQDLESAVAAYCQSEFAIGCASGSEALLLALMAFDIGPGDEVLIPSFTFFATASCVTRLGATPVWVDIEPVTFNMDPEDLAKKITPRSKAVIPVHLFGQCAELATILEISSDHGLRVIEDAAQAIGAEYGGRRAGGIGDVGCFSFYPTKNLGAFGDAGMLTTQDAEVADRLRLLANHGMRPRYHHSEVGINSRLDSMQAIALRNKLEWLPRWEKGRQENARQYDSMFREAGIASHITLPKALPHLTHVWNQYTIRISDGRRDAVRAYLADQGVGSEIYYPIPLHKQECFKGFQNGADQLPVSEQASAEVLSIPIFAELTDVQQQRVVDVIGDALKQSAH